MATVTTQQQLNDQLVLSINWTQESGEFAAVAYQAFNLAKRAFDQALASGALNPAVSVDLDETLLGCELKKWGVGSKVLPIPVGVKLAKTLLANSIMRLFWILGDKQSLFQAC